MKKILLTLALAVGFSVAANAQTPTYAYQTIGSFTNQHSTATNTSYVIDCRKQQSVCLQWLIQGTTTTTETNNLFFQRSVDGVTYSAIQTENDTTPLGLAGKRITITPNGTAIVCLITNIPTQGCGYIKIVGATNSAITADVTNTLSYAVKISSP